MHMMTLFTDGGFSMFFVLGFGFVALAWAAWYAARGRRRPLSFVYGMMAATFFATASGVFSDLGMVFKTVATLAESGKFDPKNRVEILLMGLGESMAPAIMGFSLLALTALLLAVGGARVSADANGETATA